MTAAEAQIAAIQRLSDRTQADTGQHRGAVSAGRSAAACGSLNPTYAWAADISGGGPTRQPGLRRRLPWTQVDRRPGWHFAAGRRPLTTLAGFTSTAIVQPAGPTPHIRRRG